MRKLSSVPINETDWPIADTGKITNRVAVTADGEINREKNSGEPFDGHGCAGA